MRHFIYILNSLFFIILILWGGVAFWGYPKQTISTDENRNLRSFPNISVKNIFSGKFEKEFEEYYNDHFPLRDKWINFAHQLDILKGIQEQEIRVVNIQHSAEEKIPETENNDDLETVTNNQNPNESGSVELEQHYPNLVEEIDNNKDVLSENKLIENTDQSEKVEDQEFSKIKGVVIVNNRVLQIFAGSKSTITPFTNMLNKYRTILPNEVKMYAMITPSGSDFYLPYQINKGKLKEKENINLFKTIISPEINFIADYDELSQHKKEDLFFKTDHHWTALGAYYAYLAFAKQANFIPLKLNEMAFIKKDKTFLGSLYNYTKDQQLKKNPDLLEYYKIPDEQSITVKIYPNKKLDQSYNSSLYKEINNSYLVFLGGDYPLIHITNHKLNNNRKILIVKDSFGNAFIPYLASHYQDIYVVDYRYFKGNIPDFIKEHHINEFLYMHNSFAANSKAAVKFGSMMLNKGK